ncbi:metallophosphoesterase family protein [Thermophilibacter provencensis]|uniref:Metallophosphoesterase family protein n=1 Tax=Thermophilibacter provencensis TaxID=1852386 RepID=A0ABT7V5V2_9ACTN|nr:metallophosphoesterase family protein [Thermophilibacter provencensis]MDM8271984.1 metallophosphoesterase family protein [Thermophilibacter provencensis]
MRILAISDVEEGWLYDRWDASRVEGVDLIISCGDLPATYLEHIVTLANVPLLYVQGNHDTAYDLKAPEGCVSIDGHIRDFCGLRIMGLGGSIKYNDQVHGYTEAEMRRLCSRMALLSSATGGVDLVVTHAPARGYGDLEDLPHRGFEAFGALLDRVRPRYLLHGHVHMQYGRVERVREHPSGATLINVCGSYMLDIPDESIAPHGGLFHVESV